MPLGESRKSQRTTGQFRPYATPSADNHPNVVAKPGGAQLHVPQGFKVEDWADGFARSRFMLQG